MSEAKLVEFPDLGTVRIAFRNNTPRISARWKDGIVSVSTPAGMDFNEILRTIERFTPRLMSLRKDVTYREGVMEFEGITFEIRRQSVCPGKVLGSIMMPRAFIEVGVSLDMDDIDVKRAISRIMCRIALKVADKVLLPGSRKLAAELNRRPAEWGIMRGHSTLGRCSGSGVIHLSYVLVFMPQELRDYIVCHELAHLEEMSHSKRFHAICDKLCSGRAAELERKLKAYRWPIIKM